MTICESFIRFTLPNGSKHYEEIDATETGIDFLIPGDPEVWVEVKNYESPTIPADLQEAKRSEAQSNIDREEFWNAILRKFERAHHRLGGPQGGKRVFYLILESSVLIPRAIAFSGLERRIRRHSQLNYATVAVSRLRDFNDYVAGSTGEHCRVMPTAKTFVCLRTVSRCSVECRDHGSRA